MYLPVIIAQKNDETTASWIRRLTLANGFDNTEEFAQQFICDSDIANAQRFKAMLGTEDFISLYKALNLQGVSMWDLYMKTSCYGGIALFLSDARQTHYLNTAFRLGASNNSIVSASNSLTSELRFCPLCKKEDEVAGGWYYHRAHQMPSIKVCYKHGSILRRFTGKFGTELSASPQSVSCTNTENAWEQDFAVFAKELLDAAPDISAENTKAAVLREVKCQGFYAPASEYAKLNTALKNADVYVSSLSRLFVQMYDMNYVAIDTHGIIDQLVGLCMYLNLDYISSKSRPTIDADYINKVAKRHYRGIQKLMDELDDPLNEKKRQKIIEEADRKLDNLLQEHKQTAFAEKIMESAEADEKKIPLKKNIIHNIEMVVADYTSDSIAAAVDRVLISTDETDEKVLTRVVMKLLTDSEKETPTKKKKSKKKPLQTSDMVKFIIE